MHTSRDNYLINTLRFVSANEVSQIYGARLPESMTSPEMRESKAYKTYLGYAIGVTPPKIARKFKKASPSKKDINLNLFPVDEEPKFAKKKVLVMKTTRKQSSGVALRDTPVMSLSKKKEKVIVDKGKGIELLSKVALTKEAQVKEVCKKSMRDFHRTHPSDSGKVTKIPLSATKIKPSVKNEGTDDINNDHDSSSEGSDQENDSGDDNTQSDKEKGSDSEQETDENKMGSESDQQENEKEVEDDEEEKEDEFVKTPSNYTPTDDEDETNEESKVRDNAEGDEDKGMDYTTNQFDDDVDQGNENLEITLDQVIEDAHVTISTIAKKTEVPVTSSSYSSDLASKFLNFADIPPTDVEIVSPIDVHVYHEVPSNQTPTLFTVPIMIITESSPVYTTTILQSSPSFTPPPLLSTPTPPLTTKATNPLSALPDFASVF
ncbi:hypothetical protein Tco_1188963 [Tanacetum coccineum]